MIIVRELKHETFLSHGRTPEVISKVIVASHVTHLRPDSRQNWVFAVRVETVKTREDR